MDETRCQCGNPAIKYFDYDEITGEGTPPICPECEDSEIAEYERECELADHLDLIENEWSGYDGY